MNWSEQWPRIENAFDDLTRREAHERIAMLEEIRAGNPDLADELSSLLAAHDAAEGFFEDKIPRLLSAHAASLSDDLELVSGEKILHFEILRLLGEGSLAKVYLARDMELDREVALKITYGQSKEARTLAHFALDGIVQVYSEHAASRAGATLQIVCLQFIAGPTLADLAMELASEQEEKSSKSFVETLESLTRGPVAFEPASLKWRASLESFDTPSAIALIGIRLCEILGHAHAAGVLHLDIKPANILIDPYGRPFLSDFNVSTHETRLAQGDFQGMGGTPRYMSPEQTHFCEVGSAEAASAIDSRSDVYALGVVLRDLFDAIEFKNEGLTQILENATEDDRTKRTANAPVLASELSAWLRGRLAASEMKTPRFGTRWILRWPAAGFIVFVIASQIFSSIINISYNQLQIVAELTVEQNRVFHEWVLIYNLITYPLMIFFAAFELRELFKRDPEKERARVAVLKIPVILAIAITVGWIPGAWILPSMINREAGPIDSHIYWQFAGSFALGWLVSMTTTLAVSIYMMARTLYPRYWQGRSDSAEADLKLSARLNRSLTAAAALVPLSGVFLVVLMAPPAYTETSYGALKILLLVTVGFGLINLTLVQRLTSANEIHLTALKRRRSFD